MCTNDISTHYWQMCWIAIDVRRALFTEMGLKIGTRTFLTILLEQQSLTDRIFRWQQLNQCSFRDGLISS